MQGSSGKPAGCLQGAALTAGSRLNGLLARLGLTCLEDVFTPRLDEEEFELLIKFLSAVPLFRKQLARADLPLIASALKRTTWEPNSHVVEQGKEGKAFFVIQQGEAMVVVKDTEGVETVRATLYHGDYFGGHTLLEKRPNVATILAKGPLVTLSMSRQKFTMLGLHKKLKFPRRPAIYDGMRTDEMITQLSVPTELRMKPSSSLSAESEAFICSSVRSNANLKRALGEVPDEKVRQIALWACKQKVKAGSIISRTGELPTAFYVVAEGSFDILCGDDVGHKSVEATVASQTSARHRFMLKERFLHDLSMLPPQRNVKESTSTLARSKTMLVQSGKKAVTQTQGRSSVFFGKRAFQKDATSSRFKVGDIVARVIVGEEAMSQELGKVIEVIGEWPDGEAVVDFFDPPRQGQHKMQHLRPAKDTVTIAHLTKGQTSGELALLYNTRLVTTLRACEDSVVYAINRYHFKECFSRDSPQLQEHYQLLNEVNLLTPLLQAERYELARNAAGVLQFEPGARVFTQDEPLPVQHLYVINSGSCIIRMDTKDEAGTAVTKELATYQRGGTFGERMIMRKCKVPEYTIDAGPDGMTCLAIDGEIIQSFLLNAHGLSTDYGMPGIQCDALEYHQKISARRSRKKILEVDLKGLEVVRLLGEGGFGAVFLVQAKGEEYALKRMSKGFAQQAGVVKQICLERDILSMLDSPFIVQLCKTFRDEQYVYLLMEVATGGHLYQLICSMKAERHMVDASAAIFYIASVSYALEHLHERNIAYRDLKLENVLLDSQGYVKLCDMGFAKFIFKKSYTLCGTPEYMAPEMIDAPHGHDRTVDWWALGVMTYELLVGQVPWDSSGVVDDDDPMAMLLHIRGCHDRAIPEYCIPSAQQAARGFVSRLCTINTRRRLGSHRGGEEVRQDHWFRSENFNFEALLSRTLPAPHRLPVEAPRLVPPELKPVSRVGAKDDLFAPYEDDGSESDFLTF